MIGITFERMIERSHIDTWKRRPYLLRWLGRRGWGVNRGRRGGGGRRGAARRPPPPSREQLDKEIEVGSTFVYILSISNPQVYMSGTKSVLDKQLDDYRFPFLSFKFPSLKFWIPALSFFWTSIIQ